MFIDKAFGGPQLKADADCQQCKYRFITADGSKSSWHDVFPQSMGEKVKVACRRSSAGKPEAIARWLKAIQNP